MSSAVKKTATRFVPKQPPRGPARQPPRRLSIVGSNDEYTRLPGLGASNLGLRSGSVSLGAGSKARIKADLADSDGGSTNLLEKVQSEENESVIADEDDSIPSITPRRITRIKRSNFSRDSVGRALRPTSHRTTLTTKVTRPTITKLDKIEKPAALSTPEETEPPLSTPETTQKETDDSLVAEAVRPTEHVPLPVAATTEEAAVPVTTEEDSITEEPKLPDTPALTQNKDQQVESSPKITEKPTRARSTRAKASKAKSKGRAAKSNVSHEEVEEIEVSEDTYIPSSYPGQYRQRYSNLRGGEESEVEATTEANPRIRLFLKRRQTFDNINSRLTDVISTPRSKRARRVSTEQSQNVEAEEQSAEQDENSSVVTPPEPVVKPTRFDDSGRLIIDPGDLPKSSRGSRFMAVGEGQKHAINVEKFTMAEMCADLPVGSVSSQHEKFMDVLSQRKSDRISLRTKRKEAKSDPTALYKFRTELQQRDAERRQQNQSEAKEVLQREADGAPAPVLQLKMGEGGAFSLDVESTVVDRHRNNANGIEGMERVEVDQISRTINSASYSRRERPERWDTKETEDFFNAISMWGTDFNLISKLFPGRSRRQIKSKYKLEERKNPARLHLACIRKIPVDVESYTMHLNIQDVILRDTKDIEQEIENVKLDYELRMKEDADALEKSKQEDADKANAEERAKAEDLRMKAGQTEELERARAVLKRENAAAA